MSTLDKLKIEIRKLNADDQAELSRWLEKLESNQWDQQIEKDAQAGKLDKIAAKALDSRGTKPAGAEIRLSPARVQLSDIVIQDRD